MLKGFLAPVVCSPRAVVHNTPVTPRPTFLYHAHPHAHTQRPRHTGSELSVRVFGVNPSLPRGPQGDRWVAHVDKGRPGRPPVMKNSFLPLHIHPHPCVELHAHQSPCCDISHVVHLRHVAMFAWVFGAIREPKWCRWPEVSRCAARAAAARLSTPLLRAGAAMALA